MLLTADLYVTAAGIETINGQPLQRYAFQIANSRIVPTKCTKEEAEAQVSLHQSEPGLQS